MNPKYDDINNIGKKYLVVQRFFKTIYLETNFNR